MTPRPITIDCDEVTRRIRAHEAYLRGEGGSPVTFAREVIAGLALDSVRLPGVSFEGAELRDCELPSADLSGADFRGATLLRCKLQNADLRRAQFQEATITGGDWADAEAAEADFTNAEVTQAPLAAVKSLSARRLGAASLRHATLPTEVTWDPHLKLLRELTARAERTLYLLLGSCVTVVLISLSQQDGQALTREGAVDLPALDVPVPARLFFQLAPWLLVVMYGYFLSGLTRLWSVLREMPAVFPDGRYVYGEIHAFPNFTVAAIPLWNHLSPRAEARLDRFLVAAAQWCVLPLTTALVWYFHLRRHDAADTLIQAFAVGAGVWLTVVGYGMMHQNLRRGFDWAALPRRASAAHRAAAVAAAARTLDRVLRRGPTRVAVEPAWLFVGRVAGEGGESPSMRRGATLGTAGAALLLLGAGSGMALTVEGCRADSARLAPATRLCHAAAARLSHAALDSANLHGRNLRRAFLYEATATGADLERATLSGAQLSKATLTGANIKDAVLNDAVLWEAKLDRARLREAKLVGADLRGASLRGARLQGAHLTNARLTGATLEGAVVCGARFDGAKLSNGDQGALGVERVRGTAPPQLGVVHVWSPVDSARGPSYLTEEEKAEYRRWRTAATHVDRLVDYLEGQADRRRDLHAPSLLAMLDEIDVSMGENTQKLQFRTRATIVRGRRGRAPETLLYTRALHDALGEFTDKVYDKAENHCVAVEGRNLPDWRTRYGTDRRRLPL